MHDLESVAPAFIQMAHDIVWATMATVDAFAVIRLEPWRLRVFPGSTFGSGGVNQVLVWRETT